MHCWSDISQNEILHQYLSQGVSLPFVSTPLPFQLQNNYAAFSSKEVNFITCEVKDLLQSGAIEVCKEAPQCISPIRCVPKKGKDNYRLITDLRLVNTYLDTPKFKYEDINRVIQEIDNNDQLISVDLKNGFQHILVNIQHRDYLAFEWLGCYYRYRVLPFGLACSPYFFCKILRFVATYLRQEYHMKLCFFSDDILLMAPEETIIQQRDIILMTLQRLGWQVNWEKSSLSPQNQIEYIGYHLATNQPDGCPTLAIPAERIRKARKDIRRIRRQGRATAKGLARIAGQLISMAKAILPAKLLLRNLYRLLKSRRSWEDILYLDLPTQQDLAWWETALVTWNGHKIEALKSPTIQIETDASQTGWGAAMANGKTAAGFWDTTMSQAPSNAREMAAVIMALLSFREDVAGTSVQVLTDNISTAAYIMHLGGQSAGLTILAAKIHEICFQLGVKITAKYLAGSLNTRADTLSRLSPHLEWQLHPRVFRMIDHIWGPHTIDRFASVNNYQLPVYNSLHYDPFTAGIDALAQNDWKVQNKYVNAPFNLLPKVIEKVSTSKATATVIAPMWPGRPWFQKLCQLSVARPIKLPARRGVIWSGGVCPEPLRNPRWKVYAWRICGERN